MSGPDGSANPIYSEVPGEKFDVKDNQCYLTTLSCGANSHCDAPKDSKSAGRAVLVVFVLWIALLLGMVAACVAFALEISNLKSETASIQTASSIQQPQSDLAERIQNIENVIQQLQQELLHSNQQLNALNSSIDMVRQIFGQNYTVLDSTLQQLSAGFGTRGQYASFPADSCAALPPSSPSGYYWVRTAIGSAVRVYCDVTRSCGGVTGGWRRVAYLDMTNSSHQCPSALRQRTDSNIRTCGTNPSVSCSSLLFTTNGLRYSQVCGKIIGYQVGTPDSFGDNNRLGGTSELNSAYVDGVSLTYGSPRRHIWTFAAAYGESGLPIYNCPCINIDQAHAAVRSPPFVGNDYFCDTGAEDSFSLTTFYGGDPLWDGAGCGPLSTCCSFNNPPWFYKQLPQPTTDGIEMRVCINQGTGDENIAIEMVEIYVQ